MAWLKKLWTRLFSKQPTWEEIQQALSPEFLRYAGGLTEDTLADGAVAVIHPLEGMKERHEANLYLQQIQQHVVIGHDSAGNLFLLPRDGSSWVFMVDGEALSQNEPQFVHNEFLEWIDEGCGLPDDHQYPFPFHGTCWLISLPENALLSEIMDLNKLLRGNWPAAQLRNLADQLPVLLTGFDNPHEMGFHVGRGSENLKFLGYAQPLSDEPDVITPYVPEAHSRDYRVPT